MFSILKKIFSAAGRKNLSNIIQEGAILVDVRSSNEFAQGHVKQSINIPLDKIEKNLHLLRDKKNIVVFCRSGNRSSQAKILLHNNGIINVTNGGTWQDVQKILNK